jgi:hypothetical protein
VGAFAVEVGGYLRDALAERLPRFAWETEYRVAETPVDVAGVSAEHLVLLELEWRRADPADNTAKLCRHLASGRLEHDRIDAVQAFTGYYDLASGGVSSKRKNAEFVGRVAADGLDRLAYHPVEFDLAPPKRGGERPENWQAVVDRTADEVVGSL